MGKILVVDDEPKIVQLLHAYLARAGYQVITATDGLTAIDKFHREHPNLVILDILLPGLDGLEICQIIREEGDTPIIMLTARVEEDDRILGLELGADDYVTKPFSPREVVARVKAVLRRAHGEATDTPLEVGQLRLDSARREVTLNGQPVSLTATEFDLLHTLMRQPGRPFSRLQLLEQVQGYAYDGYERTIDTHIKNLRQKLGDSPRQPHYILTVRGVGYKMAER